MNTKIEPSMTFEYLRNINLQRSSRWHPTGIEAWSASDWGIALGGEVGEAFNIVKKMNRVRDNLQQNAVDTEKLREMLADEIGDIGCYLDLFASRFGLRLEDCIRNKFNAISLRENFPERL